MTTFSDLPRNSLIGSNPVDTLSMTYNTLLFIQDYFHQSQSNTEQFLRKGVNSGIYIVFEHLLEALYFEIDRLTQESKHIEAR